MAIQKRLIYWWKTRPIYWQLCIGWALTGHSLFATLKYVGRQYRKKARRALQKLGIELKDIREWLKLNAGM